ncbi:MAG: FkbM family methyltransferase [Candidatus Thorarchaeota archaeon]
MNAFAYLIAPFYGCFMIPTGRGSAVLYAKGQEMHVYPDISAIDCYNEVWRECIYERFIDLGKCSNIVDVGANVGFFTIRAAKAAKGKVIAVEPSPRNFILLIDNIRRHRVEGIVIPVRKALSDYCGTTSLIETQIAGQHRLSYLSPEKKSTRVGVPVREISVGVVRLDDILVNAGFDRIDFLKIDVEGAELEVLRGGAESLAITQNIALETHGKSEAVESKLLEEGFTVSAFDNMIYARKDD